MDEPALLLRRLALLLVVLACALPLGLGAAQADDDRADVARDAAAVAVADDDGARDFDLAWSVATQRGGRVEQLSEARAFAYCSDCGATAIAFQVLLVVGEPDSLAPVNRAVAVDDQCTDCAVAAQARQLVRVVGADARFTREGRRELAAIREDLAALDAVEDLTPEALQEAVEAQEARALAVLRDEVVATGGSGELALLDERVEEDADG